jgi:hypothetical protein
VKACQPLDTECSSPVAEVEGVIAGELAEMALPVGFAGYLQFQNPGTLSALHFLGRPLLEDTRGWDLTIADQTTVVGLGLATATAIDPTLGAMIVIARDCDAVPLEGVQFSNSSEGVQFYIVNTFPTPEATQTTSQGSGGFVNVPPGRIVVSELTPTSATIRPIGEGWVSYLEVFP